jgi:hypothetical protein
MGSYRGGTTAVTSALMGLGVDIATDSINPLNLEDRPFFRLVHDVKCVDVDKVGQYIDERNSVNIWGVKYPAMHQTLQQYIHLFRNPHLVLVWRDPVAIAESEHEKKIITNRSKTIRRTISYYNDMIKITKENRVPVHFISFEKLLIEPKETIIKLNEWIGLDGDVDQAIKMIDYQGSYEQTKTHCVKYQGIKNKNV